MIDSIADAEKSKRLQILQERQREMLSRQSMERQNKIDRLQQRVQQLQSQKPQGLRGQRAQQRLLQAQNRLLSFAPLPVNLFAGGRFKDAVGHHHRHQRVEVVAIPCVSEAFEQLQQRILCHRLGLNRTCARTVQHRDP